MPLAYLFGLFRTRLARIGLGELVVELGNNPEPGRLRDALARALRDPSLELGYWMPASQEYVDVDGKQVDVVPTAARAVTILERRGEKVAALVHDAALSEDPALLDAVSSAAGLALDNERLLAELRAQLAETRDSRARIVDAGVTERRRLERNLHDGAQQRLVTLALHLRMAQETLRDDPAAAGTMLDGVGHDLKLALEELRELARGLHPAILTERGLAPALQSLATRAPFTVEINGVPPNDSRSRSKPRSTTSSPRPSPTRRSTPAHPRPRSSCRRPAIPSRSRFATTAAAAPTWPTARESAGSPTASKRSADASSSRARSEPEPSSRQSCHCAEHRTAAPAERRRPPLSTQTRGRSIPNRQKGRT